MQIALTPSNGLAKRMVKSVQDYSLFSWQAIAHVARKRRYIADTIQQADLIGVRGLADCGAHGRVDVCRTGLEQCQHPAEIRSSFPDRRVSVGGNDSRTGAPYRRSHGRPDLVVAKRHCDTILPHAFSRDIILRVFGRF